MMCTSNNQDYYTDIVVLSTDTDFDHNYHLVVARTDHQYMQGFLENNPEPVFVSFAV